MKKDFVENFSLAARVALFVFAISFGAVVLLAGAKSALAASLRNEGVITGDHIRLGDIFDGVKNADYVLGPAPQPGKDMILNARTLYKIASALNVSWTPSSTAEQIVLRREATIISQVNVTDFLKTALKKQGIDTAFSVEYLNAPSDIVLSAESDATMDITTLTLDPQTDQFKATIAAPSAKNPQKQISVSGRIERLIPVPVLMNSLKNGDIISTRDIDWIELPKNKIANGTILNETDIVNMTPRRSLFGGKPIIQNELERPKLVSRGGAITLIFATGPMVLTTKGKSLQDGAVGDVVRVSNTDSSKNLQGTVTGDREVTIQ